MNKCDCCGKVERFSGDFYVGVNPYDEEMALNQTERDELPDEVLCDGCYSDAVGDI